MKSNGRPLRPVWVSLTLVPETYEKTLTVRLFPKRLFQGMFSPSNLRTPSMRRSGSFLSASMMEAMHPGVCCPSESAVTQPKASGIFSAMYENAVLSALPLPLFGRYEISFPPFASISFSASAKIASYSVPLPSLTITTGPSPAALRSLSSDMSRSSGSYEGITIGTVLVISSI